MFKWHIISIVAMALFLNNGLVAQLSPGDLAKSHAHLEGMSNCTKCHLLGEKVSNKKCLDCHSKLKNRIDQNKGYHSSSEIRGKDCSTCHSDHHGRNFEMIRFDTDKFNHSLTGYDLLGTHAREDCKNCHKKMFIKDSEIKKKKYTYLGLNAACISCHEDYHQNTLSTDCISCHDFEKFRPAPKFKHEQTIFPLLGKHQETECEDCHKTAILNGKEFQKFTGIPHDKCTSCHVDVHNNRFGQNCVQCHSEVSFHVIKGMNTFDHGRTNYQLEGKHRFVDCKACHKARFTDPIKHNRCMDCHADYHENQFAKPQATPDCSDCHTTNGFTGSLFTITQHNQGNFQLEGAHLATPCFACHKKQEKWSFRNIGMRCIDCHENIHEPYLDKKYYPEATCESCHGESRWDQIDFDHSRTEFELLGAHTRQTCRSCHFKKGDEGNEQQQFTGLKTDCVTCHQDVHQKQFEKAGVTECISCHEFENWSASKFDHNKTLFELDGAHQHVACKECHKPAQTLETTYILYKIQDFRCETCHK